MLLMLAGALAAEGPLEVEGMPEHYGVQSLRGPVAPWAFANQIDDEEVIALYRRSNRLRKTISVVGWSGGGAAIYLGLGGFLVGGLAGSPPVMLIGASLSLTGAGTIGLATASHIMWGRRLGRYESWWTYDEAVELTTAYNARIGVDYEGGEAIEILDDALGFAAFDAEGRLNTGDFAERVGDQVTYRKWNGARRSFNILGWTTMGVGLYCLGRAAPEVLPDLSDGQVPDLLMGGVALFGLGATVAGPTIVYGSKVFYNDLNRFYTREEAEEWVRASQPVSRARVEMDLYPMAMAVRW